MKRGGKTSFPPASPAAFCRTWGGALPSSAGGRCRFRLPLLYFPLKAHAVGVAVSVGAVVGVAVAPGVGDFAQDDDAGGAAVDAQCAAGADVFVDDEEH